MKRIKPSEATQAQRFGHERVDASLIERYQQAERDERARALGETMRAEIDARFDRALGESRR